MTSIQRLILPVIFLAISLCSEVVEADEVADIERITTTASRLAASNDTLPVVVSQLNADELAMLSATHVEQALKHIAGANLQRGSGQEYLPALRSPVFSGAGACGGLLTAEDGIALRAAGFCNINELFEAHSEMAERIEVLKGPGSALYGSNAVHGVINVITPDTTHDEGKLGVDYGSFGYSRLKLRAGNGTADSGLGINASLTDDSGYRDDESVKQQKINLRHRLNDTGESDGEELSVISGLTYTHLDQQTAGYIDGFESYRDRNLSQQNFDPEAFRRDEAWRLWSQLHWLVNEQNNLTITPYLRYQDMTFLKHFLPGKPIEKNSQKGVGLQSLWLHNVSPSMTLSMGVDSEFTRGELLDYQDSPTEGSAFLIETVPIGKHYDYSVDARQIAPFVSVDWTIQDWIISAGARYETMHYDYSNHMLAGRTREDGSECGMGGCRYSRPASRTDSFSNLSPKFGLSYRISDALLVYSNLSQGFRAPQTAELYQLQRDQHVAELKSETASNIELGLKARYTNLHYVLSVYSMIKDNVIFRDSDFFYLNDARTRHRGIELELSYQLNEQWQFALAATEARHTYAYSEILNGIDINGNDIDTAPRTLANLQINWQPLDVVEVALEWQHVDGYFTDAENLHRYAGHDLLNLTAAWELNEALWVQLQITNLNNQAYADRADYTSFNGDRYFPGRPRSGMLSLSYQW